MFPEISSPNFSHQACRMMALAASAAYAKSSEIEARARAAGATQFSFIENKGTDTQAFVASTDKDLVVAFRGSSSVRDWITDLEFKRSNWNGYSVHSGFGAAFESVCHPIEMAVTEQRLNEKNIWVTGHSLGGALAVLGAIYMRDFWGAQIAGLYTFGQPRVGDLEFSIHHDLVLGDKTFRLVNEEDIVPRVPGVLFGFRHAGNEIFLNAFGGVQVNPPIWTKLGSDIIGLTYHHRRKRFPDLCSD